MASKEVPFADIPHIKNAISQLDYTIGRDTLFLSRKAQQFGKRGLSLKTRTELIQKVELYKRRSEQIRGEFNITAKYPEVRQKLSVTQK